MTIYCLRRLTCISLTYIFNIVLFNEDISVYIITIVQIDIGKMFKIVRFVKTFFTFPLIRKLFITYMWLLLALAVIYIYY